MIISEIWKEDGGVQNGRGGGRGEDLKERTKRFALRIIEVVEKLPKRPAAGVIGNQLLKSGTSVGANYRAACRPRSLADFIAKLTVVEEEADESNYWMELLVESRLVPAHELSELMTEGDELVAIVVASINTAKRRRGSR